MSSVTATTRRVLQACVATAVFCLVLLAVFWRYTHYRARLAVAELMEMAREEDTSVERGYHLINNLSRLGSAGIEALARELRSDDEWRRYEAYSVLMVMDILNPTCGDLGTYAELVADQRIDLHVRLMLARTILSSAPPRPVRSIRRHMEVALGDPVPAIRGVAAAVLWRTGRRGEELIEPLAQALESFPQVHIVATVVADPDGPDGPSLHVRDEEQEETIFGEEIAIEALRAFGEKAVRALAAAVAEGDGSPRAAELLAELGPKAAPAAPALAGRLSQGWPFTSEDSMPVWMSEWMANPAARALFAIGRPAADAVLSRLKELPEEKAFSTARLKLLLVLDRIGGATSEIAVSHLRGEHEGGDVWGAWRVARFLVEGEPVEWWSHPALAPGEDGSPPDYTGKLLERRWVLVGLLEKDYEQLPSKYPGLAYRWGGGPKEPWWETTRYDTWVKTLGYRRASARRLGAWLIGMDAKDDPKVRGCGDIPSVLLKCADDPDGGVRSAARWAVGILEAETDPDPEVGP